MKCNMSNECLMMMVPLAIWGHKLNEKDLLAAVKLVTSFTHSSPFVIGACYLYCYAIGKLVQGIIAKEVFAMAYHIESLKFDNFMDEHDYTLNEYLAYV
jgi:ADP-ribosylglycohydrolase